MQFFLISDNTDTMVGMRLAGISGMLAHKEEEIKQALENIKKNDEIAVVLITERLVNICRDYVYNLKLTQRKPLIVEIPDRHGNGLAKNSITSYVRDAIGLKI